MFSKKNRLAKPKDISLVYARGRSFFTPYFSLKFFAHSADTQRFTVVVSTKVSKKATVRNSLKRHLRETLKANLLVLRKGDYIITLKSKSLLLTPMQLRQELQNLLVHTKLVTPT